MVVLESTPTSLQPFAAELLPFQLSMRRKIFYLAPP